MCASVDTDNDDDCIIMDAKFSTNGGARTCCEYTPCISQIRSSVKVNNLLTESRPRVSSIASLLV